MSIAADVSLRGTCSRKQVGAVVAHEFRVVSTGYNGVPAGLPHCHHPINGELAKITGCEQTVHAEANALVFAAKSGIATDGATLFTTVSPCRECAKLIINSGIRRVVYSEAYRKDDGLKLLLHSRIPTDRLIEW